MSDRQGERLCNCADPENCTQPLENKRCRKIESLAAERASRESLAAQLAALRAAAKYSLDAWDAEARATLAASVAVDNYSDPLPEIKAQRTAMVAASKADAALRAALDAGKAPEAPGQ